MFRCNHAHKSLFSFLNSLWLNESKRANKCLSLAVFSFVHSLSSLFCSALSFATQSALPIWVVFSPPALPCLLSLSIHLFLFLAWSLFLKPEPKRKRARGPDLKRQCNQSAGVRNPVFIPFNLLVLFVVPCLCGPGGPTVGVTRPLFSFLYLAIGNTPLPLFFSFYLSLFFLFFLSFALPSSPKTTIDASPNHTSTHPITHLHTNTYTLLHQNRQLDSVRFSTQLTSSSRTYFLTHTHIHTNNLIQASFTRHPSTVDLYKHPSHSIQEQTILPPPQLRLVSSHQQQQRQQHNTALFSFLFY